MTCGYCSADRGNAIVVVGLGEGKAKATGQNQGKGTFYTQPEPYVKPD